tara:strand:- start:22 stop:852 length:831 start_codon:yes stop_codon:yes gene_type:complete
MYETLTGALKGDDWLKYFTGDTRNREFQCESLLCTCTDNGCIVGYPWTDSLGNSCEVYEAYNSCLASEEGYNNCDLSSYDACCHCGGGSDGDGGNGGDYTGQYCGGIDNRESRGGEITLKAINMMKDSIALSGPHQPSWGWIGDFFCPNMGDINGDGGWNVLDIVALVNCVLANDCAEQQNACASDMNGDGGYNVFDIQALCQCVLAANCGGRYNGRPELDTPYRYLPPKEMTKEEQDRILQKVLDIAGQPQALNNPDDRVVVQEIVYYLNSERIF